MKCALQPWMKTITAMHPPMSSSRYLKSSDLARVQLRSFKRAGIHRLRILKSDKTWSTISVDEIRQTRRNADALRSPGHPRKRGVFGSHMSRLRSTRFQGKKSSQTTQVRCPDRARIPEFWSVIRDLNPGSSTHSVLDPGPGQVREPCSGPSRMTTKANIG